MQTSKEPGLCALESCDNIISFLRYPATHQAGNQVLLFCCHHCKRLYVWNQLSTSPATATGYARLLASFSGSGHEGPQTAEAAETRQPPFTEITIALAIVATAITALA
jgi:hypothetical protein